ncbi:tetratricopeptide repeat protein [Methanothrix sp.]
MLIAHLMFDPYSLFEHAFHEIKLRVPSLTTIEQKSFSLLKIIMIFCTISFLIAVIFWMLDEDDDIFVQPFETVGIGENLDGKSLATLLSFDLQKIKNIYETKPKRADNPKDSREITTVSRPLWELDIPNYIFERAPVTPLEYSLSQIGTVGVGGASISIGNLLLSMKEFLGNNANVITCSLQRYNSSMFVVAILEDHHTSNNIIITYENEANISKDEQIPLLVNDLAFMIALDLSKKTSPKDGDLYPQTWQAFKYVTESRDAYNNYKNKNNNNYTNKLNYLNRAKNMALLAAISEPGYNGSFELLSALGFAYLEMEKFDEAEKIFRNVTEVKPFESAVGLGLFYGMQNRYAEALNAFDHATRLMPHDAYSWNSKGIILSKQGNYCEAVKAFKNATRLDPNWATAWKYEGDAIAHLGKNNRSMYNESLIAYNEAIKINPLYAEAWTYKGIALYNAGRYNESIEAFDESIKINPQYTDTWVYKGMALFALGRYNESIQAFDKAIQIDPDNTNALTYREYVREKLNEHDDSVKVH